MNKKHAAVPGALGLLLIIGALVLVIYFVDRPMPGAPPATALSAPQTPETESPTLTEPPFVEEQGPTSAPATSASEQIPTDYPSATPTALPPRSLSELPITFPIMSPDVADYFNRVARADDIALIPAARLFMLSAIDTGRSRVGFASWAEAEQALDGLIGEIDFVTYNPEHWAQTPSDEQGDLISTVQRAAEFAHSRGVQLMVSPDRRFARESLGEIAKYADMIGLQGQRVQNDPAAFEAWARELIQVARASNPEVKIFVQVGATQGTAEQMLSAIKTIEGAIDGIAIWSAPSTLPILQEFVSKLRP